MGPDVDGSNPSSAVYNFRSVALNLVVQGRVSKTRGKRFDSSPSCFGNEQKIVVIGHD